MSGANDGGTPTPPLFVLKKGSDVEVLCCSFFPSRGIYDHFFSNLLISGDTRGEVTVWDLNLRRSFMVFSPAALDPGQSNHHNSNSPLGVIRVGFLPLDLETVSSRGNAMPTATTCPPKRFSLMRYKHGEMSAAKHECFFVFAQCRNQQLYLFRMERDQNDASTPTFVRSWKIPLMGFCQIGVYHDWALPTTRFAIPHESNGTVSVWHVEATAKSIPECRLLTTFTSASGFKCGVLMGIYFQAANRISLSFESGHVVLYCVDEKDGCNKALLTWRPFSTPALMSVWRDNEVYVCSPEGVECFRICGKIEISSVSTEDDVGVSANGQEAQLIWDWSSKKGVGSIAVEGALLLAGCWDGTIRLFLASTGMMLTILTQHTSAVNCVTFLPSMMASSAQFSFDPRYPHVDGKKQEGYLLTEGAVPKGEVVMHQTGVRPHTSTYLFASASNDHTLALWKVNPRST